MYHARFGRRFLALAASVVMGGALFATALASPAAATYGPGAQYQIELSANIGGRQGGGVWLWITLNQNGTGDYAGSDCGHGGQGAASDKGDVTWAPDHSGHVVITGVVLNGLGSYPTTITVPAAYGHYSAPSVSAYLTLPGFIPPIGFSQLQVAP